MMIYETIEKEEMSFMLVGVCVYYRSVNLHRMLFYIDTRRTTPVSFLLFSMIASIPSPLSSLVELGDQYEYETHVRTIY